MSTGLLAVALVSAVLGPLQGFGASPADSVTGPPQEHPQLFGSHDLLAFTLEVPLEAIFKEREQESTEHPAVLVKKCIEV